MEEREDGRELTFYCGAWKPGRNEGREKGWKNERKKRTNERARKRERKKELKKRRERKKETKDWERKTYRNGRKERRWERKEGKKKERKINDNPNYKMITFLNLSFEAHARNMSPCVVIHDRYQSPNIYQNYCSKIPFGHFTSLLTNYFSIYRAS